MASCANSPTLLKTWVEWFKGSVVLRLLGLPVALLGLCFEFSPATSSLILYRLSRRLRRSFLLCTHGKDNAMSVKSSAGGTDAMDRAQPQPKPKPNGLARKRSMTLGSDRSRAALSPGVQLASNLSGHRSDPPAPSTTITTTTTTTSSPSPLEPSPDMSSHSRSKTMSHVDVLSQGKRLSLQFPIQPAAGSNSPIHTPRSRPQSWAMAPSPLSPDSTASSPEPNLLAVLAAQERYVLELREELTKAEADLKTLKRQWSMHEANKRRSDSRRVAQMQPVNTLLIDIQPDQEDDDGSISMQREMERRKALLNNTKSSQRKVFSGSRHLRTLSLLSPDKSYTPSFPQPIDVHNDEPMDKQPVPLSRTSTSSDLMRNLIDDTNMDRSDTSSVTNMQRDNIIRASSQIATDFKNGLVTFFEDIRQATVGDEAVSGNDNFALANGRGPSKQSVRNPSGGRPPLSRSASSKKTTPRSGSIGDDFWKEHGLSEPTRTTMNKKTHAIKTPQKQTQRAVEEFEDWDNWDTPSEAKAVNTHDSSDESDVPSSETSGSAQASKIYHSKRHDSKASSQTTASSVGHADDAAPREPKRNSIPWPDLVKLSPTHLKRTASHLMKEWEKQLTPPPESRDSTHSHGDYLGRCGSPTGLP
ncbi:hypothetical protein P153DRAFT_370072 [Dothidotthia symphoricarpi CBS 119687]|uniref:DUF4048 domain-containing protein n=1 Tax=Dothidotthia symphoricarpi CBS 119687 TaxID=1392245 RepID=A0A6A6A2J3_9PLEO|nr:uncharacterized protein P153DRAFT_370072 [Dothidotthia symphoricarpi CBS 119687]KAF2125403.1 hypothetical protein P153DRAFT_370072 [Dothidotthia symphoricarpi CBS 119687]